MQATESAQSIKKQGNQAVSDQTVPERATPREHSVVLSSHSSLPAVETAIKNCPANDVADALFEIVSADKDFKQLQLMQLKLAREYFKLTEKLDYLKSQNLEKTADFEKDSLRRESVTTELNINKKALVKFSEEYLSGNPIGIESAEGVTVSLSVVTARSDFSAHISSFVDLARTKDINHVFDTYKSVHFKKENSSDKANAVRKSIDDIDDYIKKFGHLFETEEKYTQIKNAFDKSKNEDVISLSKNYFHDVSMTPNFVTYAAQAKPIYEKLASHSAEELQKIGIIIKRNSNLFDNDLNGLLSKLNNSPEQLTNAEKDLAKSLKKKFWDVDKNWTNPTQGEADVTALLTSYATLKRLSEIVSATESKLEEISKANSNLTEKSTERKKVIDKLWQVYFDTSKHISEELSNEIIRYLGKDNQIDQTYLSVSKDAIEGNPQSKATLQAMQLAIENKKLNISSDTIKISKILSDTNHPRHQEYLDSVSKMQTNEQVKTAYLYQLAKPYQGLINALQIIDRNSLGSYTPEMYANHVSLMEHTLHKIDPAFNQIMGYLESTSASPKKIEDLFGAFLRANETHPEIDALRAFSKNFKLRFSRVILD